MHWNFLQSRSLKVKITLFALVIFVASFWSLAYYASRMLRSDMEQLLGAQQYEAASFLATSVQQQLTERLTALETVAGEVRGSLLAGTTGFTGALESRPVLQRLFNGGVVVVLPDGTLAAPLVPANRPLQTAADFDRSFFQRALALAGGAGTSYAGVNLQGIPFVATVFPVKDNSGGVMGALVGLTDLGTANFLDAIAQSDRAGHGAYLLVVDPQRRTILASSDKTRVMQVVQPGASTLADRFIDGYEGSGIAVNPSGSEVLSSAKGVPGVGWVVTVSLPADRAFAPIGAMQQRMFFGAALLTLLAGVLTWWMLRRQLAPMLSTVRTLTTLSNTGQSPKQLPVASQDEIGSLVASFNHLLDTMAQRDALHRQILDTSSVAIFLVDMHGRITQANQPMARMFGRALESLEGAEYVSLVHPREREEGREKMLALLGSKIAVVDVDRLYWREDGTEFWGRLTGRRFVDASGQDRGLVGVIADITERKQMQRYELFRSRILEMLTVSQPLDSVLVAMVQGVEQILTSSLCSILVLDEQGKHIHQGYAPSLPDAYNAALEGLAIGIGAGSCGAAAFTGERVVVVDIATHPYWAPYRDLAASAGLAACWSQPFRDSSGRVIGTFAIYHRTPHAPTATDITIIEQSAHLASIAIERSQDARKLQESEAHFRLLTEDVSDVVWKTDKDFVFTYISPADERLRGYRADEVVGRKVSDLFNQDGIATVRRAIQQREADAGSPSPLAASFEAQQRCKDGRWVWTEILAIAERDAGGIVTGYHGITRDITARRQSEESLQLAASVFSHAQEGILITNLDGIIIDVNAAFTRITGYSREEVLGSNPRMLSSGRHGDDFYAALYRELHDKGQWQGETWNRRKNGEMYAQTQTISTVNDAQGRALHYVALFSDITDQKMHQSQLEHIAHFDALTNLPNRVLLGDRLHQGMAQSARRGEILAVAFLDLDGFKAINDQFGHDVGDHLLVALAARMKSALRDGDTLARIGGDEFVAVIADIADTAASVPLLHRLLAAAAQPVQVGAHTLQVSASVGVTFFPQSHEVDPDHLLRQADQAMYQAKLAGKNRYHVFDAAHDSRIRGHHESIEHIRRALAQKEFVLHYQPKVNMRTGAVTGAEALIRWQHPEKGLLSPAVFLPVIEEHALSVEVGEWVIDTALAQVELWRAEGLDIPVSVNIGARQLQDPNFVVRLRELLAAHPQVKPECLELEVLETSALEDLSKVSHVIRTCLGIGVTFALDDFGTGYSSLTYLKHLPAATLKIDQSFVRDMLDDPDDLAILEGVLGLATAFRRGVIAEGVETIAHGIMLLQLGCEMGQGYGIAHPMPGPLLPQWAAGWRPSPAWNNLPLVQRQDYPILFASVEHRAWSMDMENFLTGRAEAPPALDHHQCHFGQWLLKEGLVRHGKNPAFAGIAALHQDAHALAIELCDMYADGHVQVAQQRLGELHAMRDALLEQVKLLLPAPQ